jgi:hypothetical protein
MHIYLPSISALGICRHTPNHRDAPTAFKAPYGPRQ